MKAATMLMRSRSIVAGGVRRRATLEQSRLASAVVDSYRHEAPEPAPESHYAVARNVKMGETRSLNGFTASVRNDWTKEEIAEIYQMPMLELLYRAATVHRMFFNPREVQQCTLLSIKTGGCTEDCSYCSQSVRHKTFVKPTPQMKVQQCTLLSIKTGGCTEDCSYCSQRGVRHKTFVKPTPQMKVQEVLEAAARAKAAGSTRFCMGAAWREMGNKKNAFNHILDMVKGVNGMGLEVCCTLGMLSLDQAKQLKEAGLSAYNHNLDTSREHYAKVITTRTYDDRLQTIANVREAGISVCCGGILGLGEKESDRVGLLHTLATLDEHPESVPINALVAIDGTPIAEGGAAPPDIWDMGRMIATARILMPRTMVRLSAGRLSFSEGEQALMFMAGANSIFNGDKLLTTPNPEFNADTALFNKLGLVGKPSHMAPQESPLVQQSAAPLSERNYEELGCTGKFTPVDGSKVVITHTSSKQASQSA